MAKWWKSGLFALAVYLGGVLTKPVQTYLEEYSQRRKIRQILYNELADSLAQVSKLYESMRDRQAKVADKGEKEDVSLFTNAYISLDCFEYAKKHPTVFNQLEEANHLKALYGGLSLLKMPKEVERQELVEACEALMNQFRQLVSGNFIDRKRFVRALTGRARRVLRP